MSERFPTLCMLNRDQIRRKSEEIHKNEKCSTFFLYWYKKAIIN